MAGKTPQQIKREILIKKITKLLDDHALDTGDALIACFYKPTSFDNHGNFIGSTICSKKITKSIEELRQKRLEYAASYEQRELQKLAEAGFIVCA